MSDYIIAPRKVTGTSFTFSVPVQDGLAGVEKAYHQCIAQDKEEYGEEPNPLAEGDLVVWADEKVEAIITLDDDFKPVVIPIGPDNRDPDTARHDYGHGLGVTWAAKHATLQEIANLDDVWRGLRPVEEDQILIPGGDAAYSAAERIYAIIAGVDPSDFDRDAAREFWNTYGPKSDEVLLDPAFLRGFIHGVGEIEGE